MIDARRQGDLDREPDEIAARAADVGRERLDRTWLDILLTGVIGGIEVSIGGIAAMVVVGSALATYPGLPLQAALALGGLVFPIGFVFVIMGHSELFTENFLIPVLAVLRGQRSPSSLLELFGISWVANIIGAAIVAALIWVPDAMGGPIHVGYEAYTQHKLEVAYPAVFVSAILAGLIMTALTWVLMSVQSTVGDIVVVFAGGYVLFAANLSHSIIGASLLFVGFVSANKTLADVLVWLLVATVGNLVGGVGLVTLFRYAQAEEKGKRG